MNNFNKPVPVDREIKLDPNRVIMSKTDAKGVIEYANDYFMDICGYVEYELMGKPHNVIRHPDMPRVIFKILWDRLHKGQNIHAVVKNLAKDGRYYWVITNFKTKFDEQGNVISHYSRRKAAPEHVVEAMLRFYRVLLTLELDDRSMKKALNYFEGFFEEKNTTYDDFILDLIGTTEAEIQEYFNNPKFNLNLKDNNFEPVVKSNITQNTVSNFIPEVETKEEISKITNIEEPKENLDNPQEVKRKSNFFTKFFLGR